MKKLLATIVILLSATNSFNAQTVITKTITGSAPNLSSSANTFVISPTLTTTTTFTVSFNYARAYSFASNAPFDFYVTYTTSTGTNSVSTILTNTTTTPTNFYFDINETTLNKISLGSYGSNNWVYNFLTIYYTVLNTGISEAESTLNELIVFPNPTKDLISIEDLKTANISVFDVLGKQVLNKEFVNEDIKISIADLPQGIYYAEIKTINKTIINKIIKE